VALLLQVVTGAYGTDVVSVEEHWELQVGGPDIGRSAPQVGMVMSPTADLEGDFFVMTLNHWSSPSFSPGGVQVQRWSGEDCLWATHSAQRDPLSTDEETITWVQRLSLDDGLLIFEVVDGESETWGEFGGDGQLKSTVPTSLSRLNSYLPANSLNGSGIGYAGNRVSSLTLKKLVWTTADGEVHEKIAPIDIATKLDP
jgi:hypothetical protein